MPAGYTIHEESGPYLFNNVEEGSLNHNHDPSSIHRPPQYHLEIELILVSSENMVY